MELTELDIALIVALAFFVGWKISTMIHTRIFSEIIKDLGIEPDRLLKLNEDPDERPEVWLRIEQVNGQLFAWCKDTGEFVAQGADGLSLVERIADRYKDGMFRVSEEDGAEHIKPVLERL